MRIAVINETSAADRNADILNALDGRGHELLNCGMKKNGEEPQLTYLHTGFMGALLLNAGAVDFVVGGCGTGQGFLNSVVQYPGVVCGHIMSPLDAWLFTRINAGNCISLMLNQGYGWGSAVNLSLVFDHLFSSGHGAGFPESRRDSQQESVRLLNEIGAASHRSMVEIVRALPDRIVLPVLEYPGVRELLSARVSPDHDLMHVIEERSNGGAA